MIVFDSIQKGLTAVQYAHSPTHSLGVAKVAVPRGLRVNPTASLYAFRQKEGRRFASLIYVRRGPPGSRFNEVHLFKAYFRRVQHSLLRHLLQYFDTIKKSTSR